MVGRQAMSTAGLDSYNTQFHFTECSRCPVALGYLHYVLQVGGPCPRPAPDFYKYSAAPPSYVVLLHLPRTECCTCIVRSASALTSYVVLIQPALPTGFALKWAELSCPSKWNMYTQLALPTSVKPRLSQLHLHRT